MKGKSKLDYNQGLNHCFPIPDCQSQQQRWFWAFLQIEFGYCDSWQQGSATVCHIKFAVLWYSLRHCLILCRRSKKKSPWSNKLLWCLTPGPINLLVLFSEWRWDLYLSPRSILHVCSIILWSCTKGLRCPEERLQHPGLRGSLVVLVRPLLAPEEKNRRAVKWAVSGDCAPTGLLVFTWTDSYPPFDDSAGSRG